MEQLSLDAVADVQSGAERVDEPNAPLLAGADHLAERGCFRGRVKLAPDHPMLQIVLGSVEVCVESPAGHPIEQFRTLSQRPRLSVEAFDHARQEICRFSRRHAFVCSCTHKLRSGSSGTSSNNFAMSPGIPRGRPVATSTNTQSVSRCARTF